MSEEGMNWDLEWRESPKISLQEGVDIFNRACLWSPELIDQGVGDAKLDGKCCVGSRIGMELELEDENADHSFWQEGVELWTALMGITRAHAVILFRMCGAGHDPFSANDWGVDMHEVSKKLSQIEEVPSLTNRDFRGVFLSRCMLADCDFSNSNFSKTNLSLCNLSRSRLCGANLRHADLGYADLSDANLNDAKVEGANFSDITYNSDTTYEGVDMSLVHKGGF